MPGPVTGVRVLSLSLAAAFNPSGVVIALTLEQCVALAVGAVMLALALGYAARRTGDKGGRPDGRAECGAAGADAVDAGGDAGEWTAAQSDRALDFLLLAGKLKATTRTGWVNHKVETPESIADHMYRMAVMALLYGGCKHHGTAAAATHRCVAMAVCHDIAEAVCGDIPPTAVSGVSKAKKHELEVAAMRTLADVLGGTAAGAGAGAGAGPAAADAQLRAAGSRVCELWNEYESAESAEALLLKDLDKAEMLVQAYEYERDQRRVLPSFYRSVSGKIKSKAVQSLVDAVHRRRVLLPHIAAPDRIEPDAEHKA